MCADGLDGLLKIMQQDHGLVKDLALAFSEDANGVSLTLTATPIVPPVPETSSTGNRPSFLSVVQERLAEMQQRTSAAVS